MMISDQLWAYELSVQTPYTMDQVLRVLEAARGDRSATLVYVQCCARVGLSFEIVERRMKEMTERTKQARKNHES